MSWWSQHFFISFGGKYSGSLIWKKIKIITYIFIRTGNMTSPLLAVVGLGYYHLWPSIYQNLELEHVNFLLRKEWLRCMSLSIRCAGPGGQPPWCTDGTEFLCTWVTCYYTSPIKNIGKGNGGDINGPRWMSRIIWLEESCRYQSALVACTEILADL